MGHQCTNFIASTAGALAIATLAAAQTPRAPGPTNPTAQTPQPKVPASPTSPDAAAPFVVMIRGTIGEAPTAGAGIIMGMANDRLYVATAYHVVRRKASDANNLQVQLKWLPGEWVPARLLEHADETLDLAVIAVPEASKLGVPRLGWPALTRPETLTRATSVFPIGYPSGTAWFIGVQPHLVTIVTPTLIRTEGNLVDGHSGGALVTQDGGIVGLVSRADALVGESQRIDRVVDKLSEWGYRVALTWKTASGSTGQPTTPAAPTGGAAESETVSSSVTVPNVIGATFADAQRQLSSAGLRVGPIERHAIRKYDSGSVYHQTPQAGAQAKRGDSVKLYIDVTPAPEYHAQGSMALTPTLVFDLDFDPGGGRTAGDFRFGTERGWQLQPINRAAMARVRSRSTSCDSARYSSEPVDLTFDAEEITICVLTNWKRTALLHIRKGRAADEILVVYSTWK
jgi:Trypsin-like peptidase domain/PASTA domain